jgi:hypothetical protein
MMNGRPRATIPITWGAVGGVLALVASMTGAMTEAMGRSPVSDTGGLTVMLVFVAGIVALARPRQVQVLVVSDTLVALALTIEMFGRLGMLYVPVLMVLVLGTMRAREPQVAGKAATEPAPQPVRPMLAADWDLGQRTREALPDVVTGETLRRAG